MLEEIPFFTIHWNTYHVLIGVANYSYEFDSHVKCWLASLELWDKWSQ